MPKQQVTLEIEVPEGWEATGEYRSVRYGETYLGSDWSPTRMTSQRETEAQWPILRRKPDPVTEWIASAPAWLEGLWVYRTAGDCWLVSRTQPTKNSVGGGFSCFPGDHYTSHSAASLSRLFGESFTPPPVDCLQVVRTNP